MKLTSLPMPSYSLMNTRVGVDFQSGTTAELFIRNVNDTDPVLGLYDDFSEYRKQVVNLELLE